MGRIGAPLRELRSLRCAGTDFVFLDAPRIAPDEEILCFCGERLGKYADLMACLRGDPHGDIRVYSVERSDWHR